MKTLWLVNGILPQIASLLNRAAQTSSTWLVSVADALLNEPDGELVILYRDGGTPVSGGSDALTYASFQQAPTRYSAHNEAFFLETLLRERSDVVHIWGTEYPSALAMLHACRRADRLESAVVSIQGLCSLISAHYTAGLPARVVNGTTLRDLLRRDNIALQQRAFRMRGTFEIEALRLTQNVIGRTDWDHAAAKRINPDVRYHRVNETLRASFYEGAWSPESCVRHSLFLPQGYYPVKGTHRALETLALIRRAYPDATLTTTGADPRDNALNARLRRSSYARYIAHRIRALGLDDAVRFTGVLDEAQMKNAYLSANVCLSASSVENSPNGVGEAMLLGTPVVSSFVGGVSSILTHGREGLLYPADEPYMAAEYAQRIFASDETALRLSRAASERAGITHDPIENLRALNAVYAQLCGGAGA